ncbi:MAG: hypothetical protein U9P61_00195 [Patescibacteria group bacterium]|nr:hypothetical protein [Patescibacteria group bacterium]
MKLKNIFIASFLLLVPFFAFSESTFPKDEAGISAYVKLEGIDDSNNATVLNRVAAFIETAESKDTHVIGEVPVEIIIKDNYHLFDIDINIYFDIEGWLVAYFPRGTESSKIVQWNDYTIGDLESSILEEAIDQVIEGVNNNNKFEDEKELDLSYSDSPDYYHFEYENANRMTIIIDTVKTKGSPYTTSSGFGNPVDYWSENSFSVTVPGIIHEASYSVYFSKNIGKVCGYRLSVPVNNNLVEVEHKAKHICGSNSEFSYGFYPENIFSENTPRSVIFKAESYDTPLRMGAATVLIYEVVD